jgi:ribosomal protein S19
MSKSQYKLPFIGREMLLKSFKRKKKNITFYQRNTLVPFCFVNKEFDIHQGLRFKSYRYRYNQLGLKLGEFAKTRLTPRHKGKRLKIAKKRPKQVKLIFNYDLKSKFFTN